MKTAQKSKSRCIPRNIPEVYLHWTLQLGGMLRHKLRTLEGQSLIIHSPGQYNLDNGPDFLNAEISLNGVRMRGDLECHPRARDWFAHGHQHDRRYERVVLHLLWEKPALLPDDLSPRIQHICLPDMLKISPADWLRQMREMADHPLAGSLATRRIAPPESTPQRFHHKIQIFREAVREHGWENTLFRGMARALGYSLNREQFWQLLAWLPAQTARRQLPAELISAPFLYCFYGWRSGLFSEASLKKGLADKFPALLDQLLYQAHFFGAPHFNRHDWHFARLRPYNSPYLRLAALALWISHYQSASLFELLEKIFYQRLPAKPCLNALKQKLILPLPENLRALLLALRPGLPAPKHTIGESRLREMTLNIFLPLLALKHISGQNENFVLYLRDLYLTLSAKETPPVSRPQSSERKTGRVRETNGVWPLT